MLPLDGDEQIVFPLNKCKLEEISGRMWKEARMNADRVNRIDPFPALVPLAFYPVPIEISEKPIDVVCTSRIPLPLGSIVLQKSLILECVRFLMARVSDAQGQKAVLTSRRDLRCVTK